MIFPKVGDLVKFKQYYYMLKYGNSITPDTLGQIVDMQYVEPVEGYHQEVNCFLYIAVKVEESQISSKQVTRFLKFNYNDAVNIVEFIPASKAARILYAK